MKSNDEDWSQKVRKGAVGITRHVAEFRGIKQKAGVAAISDRCNRRDVDLQARG